MGYLDIKLESPDIQDNLTGLKEIADHLGRELPDDPTVQDAVREINALHAESTSTRDADLKPRIESCKLMLMRVPYVTLLKVAKNASSPVALWIIANSHLSKEGQQRMRAEDGKEPDGYTDLERHIARLKRETKPLKDKVRSRAIMEVISKVALLRDTMNGLEQDEIDAIRREVEECERLLNTMSLKFVKSLIATADETRVFRIVGNANKFAKLANKSVGKTIEFDGEQLEVTPEIVRLMTRYNFSIGTPPVTPKSIEAVERIMFGGNLDGIYALRDVLQGDSRSRLVFDRLINRLAVTIDQSTHYTTAGESQAYKDEATDFDGFSGVKAFQQAIISGTADTAIRLIQERLFRYQTGGGKSLEGSPIEVVDSIDQVDDAFIEYMREQKAKIFIIKAEQVPDNLFYDSVLLEKWEGIIGRVIVIDDSETAKRTSITCVSSLIPPIVENLEKFHVKALGTPSNTQMNLRLILENFKPEDIDRLAGSVEVKIADFEAEGVQQDPGVEHRKQGWIVSRQKEYMGLVQFSKFLNYIRSLSDMPDDKRDQMLKEMLTDAEGRAMDYYYKPLKEKGYGCAYVPEGGGRQEVAHIATYHLQETQKKVDAFKATQLEGCKARLAKLEMEAQASHAESNALGRAADERFETPLQLLTGATGTIRGAIGDRLERAVYDVAGGVRKLGSRARALAESAARFNFTGLLADVAGKYLDDHELGAISKLGEREALRSIARQLKEKTGKADRFAKTLLDRIDTRLREIQRESEPEDLDTVRSMIEDIENGKFRPSVGAPAIRWTIEDVFIDDEYPADNYLNIQMRKNGSINVKNLRAQIEAKREQLIEFPELFKFWCSSVILYINDPHNPTSVLMKRADKLEFLHIADDYGMTVCSDEPYRKNVSKDLKRKEGDWSVAEFYEENRPYFSPRGVTIHTALATTKAMGAGKKSGPVNSNDPKFLDYVRSKTDGVNSLSLYMDIETLRAGNMVKKVTAALEACYKPNISGEALFQPENLVRDPGDVVEETLAKYFNDMQSEDFIAPIYFMLIEARNQIDLLKVRTETAEGYKLEAAKFLSSFISDLKNLRLEKLAQRDSQKRIEAANDAVTRVQKDHPTLEYIKPEGPFYMCVKLDETGSDQSLQPFLESLALGRNIAIVPQAGGYARFAFGGLLDGTPAGYKLFSQAIETDLRIAIKKWNEFKDLRAVFRKLEMSEPDKTALHVLFPGGEEELVRTYHDKKDLLKKQQEHAKSHKPRKNRTHTHSANVDDFISKIEPDSPAHIVTIRDPKCETIKEFVTSEPFRNLYDHYLLQVRGKVKKLQHLSEGKIMAKYGADKLAEKVTQYPTFKDDEKAVFAAVVSEIAKLWFSDDTIKILEKRGNNITKDDIEGAGNRISKFIQEVIKVFLSSDQEKQLIADINKRAEPKFEDIQKGYKATFQAGYNAVEGVTADPKLPGWLKSFIGKATYAGKTVDTDMSPSMTTGGKARVPGKDRQIFRRDGDGKTAPTSEYFSERLAQFSEVMDSSKYLMKMIQVGGTKVLTIMERSYSHYIAEELRLLPQFEVKPENLANLKPDAVSFLGLPQNVMGEDFKIGYFMDKTADGEEIPVSWVDKENITDYMGYFKKPILTVANEKVKSKEMLPIHGSAFTLVFKNGLRKTIVMGGDSGTGKSETIIAMMEQLVQQEGFAENLESIELLAGDMLSMFEGNDKQLYMLGTETGDFMRMTDISEGWQERFRRLLDRGSKTNLSDPKNPRITVSGICDPDKVSVPTRVNMFLNINNFLTPPGGNSLCEVKSQRNLLLEEYVRGYRGEKGTSGDQPNIYASLLYSEWPDKNALIQRYKEDFDKLLGWDIIVKSGKAADAILSFKDKEVEGGIGRAKEMVKNLFVGRVFSREEKNAEGEKVTRNYRIAKTHYHPRKNRFSVTIQDEQGKSTTEELTREGVFKYIYNPIASTYGGDPFVDPRYMAPLLERFAEVMKNAGVITGTLYTQLKNEGMEFEGPARAASALVEFLLKDERVLARFHHNKEAVTTRLHEKYGAAILAKGASGSIPDEVMKENLAGLEHFESSTVSPVDAEGTQIPLETPNYKYNPTITNGHYNPVLITPEISRALDRIMGDRELDMRHIALRGVNFDEYDAIKAWNNDEELIYQVMLCNGTLEIGYSYDRITENPRAVKRAQKIAEEIKKRRGIS